MRYVIIGNSAAGIGAVEGIRKVDKESEITVISGEKYHAYARPLISYLLQEKISPAKRKYRSDNFYKDNNVKLIHSTVTAVDDKAKNITIDGEEKSEKIPYDKLLVATGSRPFVPPINGLDTVEEKFTFMSLEDALSLEKALSHDKKVLIMGAGLIGLKCAEGILKRVKSITVVDLAPRILPAVLGEYGSKKIQSHLESFGIEFILSNSVKRFDTNVAYLDGGDGEEAAEIEFDILIIAAGVRPNVELLKGIADIDKGIIVNSKSETSVEDIYAAGDCTQSMDITSDESKIMALLPNAYMQGECAGINMAGGEKRFDKAFPMNAAGFMGLHMATAGSYTGTEYYENDGENYKRLFYADNKLNGFILIGDVNKSGIYTSLIREKTPLDSIDFALVCKNPCLTAFSRKEREVKLGTAQ